MRLAKRSFLRGRNTGTTAVERDNFDVEKTTTKTRLLAPEHLGKKAAWRYRVEQNFVKRPVHIRTSTRRRPPASNRHEPGNVPFTGLQYFEMYNSRSVEPTSFPTSDEGREHVHVDAQRKRVNHGTLPLPQRQQRRTATRRLEPLRARARGGRLVRTR